jgi:hypothetical protein
MKKKADSILPRIAAAVPMEGRVDRDGKKVVTFTSSSEYQGMIARPDGQRSADTGCRLRAATIFQSKGSPVVACKTEAVASGETE